MPHTSPIQAVVVGAAGYTGREAVAALLSHPGVELVGVFGSERRAGGVPLADLHPRLRGVADLRIQPGDSQAILAMAPDVVILATPVEASLELAPALLDGAHAPVVIDLSPAYRLSDAAAFEKAYKVRHPRPDLLDSAVYGLPELHRAEIAHASLIAAPGCYPTASILGLSPLVRAGVVDLSRPPIIDAVSGVSGAGRSPSERAHFCEVSLAPYAVLSHRHQPEIDEHAGARTLFTPHLAPFDRGILATIHADLAPGWSEERLRALFDEAYAAEPMVRLLPTGSWPSVGAVAGTNFCDIGLAATPDGSRVIVVSAIDNLLKGASGQGVQCMNIRFGLPEEAGLGPRFALAPLGSYSSLQ